MGLLSARLRDEAALHARSVGGGTVGETAGVGMDKERDRDRDRQPRLRGRERDRSRAQARSKRGVHMSTEQVRRPKVMGEER